MRKFQFPAILFSVLAVFLATVFLAPAPVNAVCNTGAAGLDLGSCLTLNQNQSVGQVYATPASIVNIIVNNIFIVGGFILLIMVIYSGFLFISQGPKGAEKAKEVLTTAIVGFALMFTAYWILRLIKIITGADILF